MDIAVIVATALGGTVVVQAVVIRDLAREVRALARRPASPLSPLDVSPTSDREPASEPEPQTAVRRRVGFRVDHEQKDRAQRARVG